MTRTSRARALATALVAAVAVAGSGPLRRRIAAVRAVAPELRSPILYLPLDVASSAHLAVGRRLPPLDLPVAPGIEITDRRIEAIAGTPPTTIHCYARPDRSQPSGALLWIHGGGLVMGHGRQDDGWCSRLADELGIVVVTVDYRLAPEHPFPAALDDCSAALAWVHDRAEHLGIDRDRVAVGGVSAGGGLAAAVIQRAHERGGPPVCFQMLDQPMLDDRTTLAPAPEGRGTFVWTPTSNRFGWTAYLGRPPALESAPRHAAPARTAELDGLPPTWIGIGGLDLFHDEALAYAAALEGAGVPVERRVVAGMYHGANVIAARSPSMEDYAAAMVSALGRALTPGHPG